MSDFIKRLHEERLNAWEQVKGMLDAAASEKRDLSGEEEAAYRKANARIDEIDARVTEMHAADERSKNVDQAFAALMAKPVVPGAGEGERSTPDEGAQVRSWLLGETGKRGYDVRPANGPTDWRAMTVASAAGGGNTIKTSFYDRLIQHLIVNSGMLQSGPTVLSTSTGEALQIPKTTAHSVASLVGEGPTGTLAENDPAFGQVTLNSYKYGFLMSVSHELLNDTSVDLMGYLAMQAGRALGNAFGAHLILGSGTNQPQGIGAGAVVSAGVTGLTGVFVPTGDNLIDLYYSVIAPYRSSASAGWLMRDETVAAVRKLKDSQNRYLWEPSLQVGSPDTLLGKPVRTDPNIDLSGVSGSKKSVFFGDFSQYFVRQVETIRFERSDDYAFNTDVVTFRAILRGDGDLVDTTGAIKCYQGAAS